MFGQFGVVGYQCGGCVWMWQCYGVFVEVVELFVVLLFSCGVLEEV